MRVVRSKTFESSEGTFEKIEIELTSTDLTNDETYLPTHLQAVALELKAEQHILAFLMRHTDTSKEELREKNEEIKGLYKKIMDTVSLEADEDLSRKRL